MSLKIKLKVILDIFLVIAMIGSSVTGLMLMFSPSGSGRKAVASSPLFEFASRNFLKLLHDWVSILLIVLIIFHLMLNWKIIRSYAVSLFREHRKK